MQKTSRDAKRIIQYLEGISGVGVSPTDIFIAEQMVYSFFPKTIEGHIKRMYNPDSKGNPASLEFYLKPTFSLNKGRRNKEEWQMSIGEQANYLMISMYLLEDFSFDFLKIMRQICEFDYETVKESITISIGENVHSLPYLIRVAEGVQVRKQHKQQQLDRFRDQFKPVAEEQATTRSKLEMAQLMGGWQETIENMKLQRQIDELYGGEDK